MKTGKGGGSTPHPWVDSEPTAHNPVKILILIYPGGEAAAAETQPIRSNKRQAADKEGRPLIKAHSTKVSECLAINRPPPGLWPQEPDAVGTDTCRGTTSLDGAWAERRSLAFSDPQGRWLGVGPPGATATQDHGASPPKRLSTNTLAIRSHPF